MQGAAQPAGFTRLATGIAGLDRVLQGGLFGGGLYLIQGQAGTGKTILANHLCFSHVASGGRALYITLLTETHGRLLTNLQQFRFFTAAPIGGSLIYLGAFGVLEDRGLAGLLELLRREVRSRKTTLLVLDGLTVIEQATPSDLSLKRFIQDLQIALEANACTGVLLSSDTRLPQQPAYTMVDGIIELRYTRIDLRPVRRLDLCKFRGGPALEGQHYFTIGQEGIVVFPRCEALAASPSPAEEEQERPLLCFGVAELDAMLGGGLTSGSSTMVLGSTGSGKTVLGLHFLAAGAALGEAGLYYGFYERPAAVLRKAADVGLALEQAVKAELLELVRVAPLENLADMLADELLATIRRQGIRRLLIDGLNGFLDATLSPHRVSRFFTALFERLHDAGVTTVFSLEVPAFFDPIVSEPVNGISALSETIIFLRVVEERAHLRRLLTLRKVRDRAHDLATRAFEFSAQGLEVDADSTRAEEILAQFSALPPRLGGLS